MHRPIPHDKTGIISTLVCTVNSPSFTRRQNKSQYWYSIVTKAFFFNKERKKEKVVMTRWRFKDDTWKGKMDGKLTIEAFKKKMEDLQINKSAG